MLCDVLMKSMSNVKVKRLLIIFWILWWKIYFVFSLISFDVVEFLISIGFWIFWKCFCLKIWNFRFTSYFDIIYHELHDRGGLILTKEFFNPFPKCFGIWVGVKTVYMFFQGFFFTCFIVLRYFARRCFNSIRLYVVGSLLNLHRSTRMIIIIYIYIYIYIYKGWKNRKT